MQQSAKYRVRQQDGIIDLLTTDEPITLLPELLVI